MAAATRSGTTEVRAGIPQHHPSDSSGIPGVADCSGFGCRRFAAKAETEIILDQGTLAWAKSSAQLPRRAVAVCRFPVVARITELDLRKRLFCLS